MTVLKTSKDLELMRPACQAAARILGEIGNVVRPGMTTRQVDEFAAERIKAVGGRSAFLGYRKYPCNVCLSVNDEVVHGIAGNRTLAFGDVLSVDCGVVLNGFVGDTARTFAVGGCAPDSQRLMEVTEQALTEGIKACRIGNRVSDISRAIQRFVEGHGYSVVREFVGHGVGRSLHEDPQVPNYVESGASPKLKAGMTLAIEPMVNMGRPEVKFLKDGWTVKTRDGSLSAHFEHTVLITTGEPEVLTVVSEGP
jgi:methionyl aminopeptidase